MYSRLQTAFGGTATVNGAVAQPTQSFVVKDQGVLSAIFRVQRNFWL